MAETIVLVGPSGSGKTSLRRALQDRMDISSPVSCTTRRIRPGEKDGREYHFITEEKFLEMVSTDKFLEWAVVHDNLYGTPYVEFRKAQHSGRTVCYDIDVQGARQLKKKVPGVTLVFVMVPSVEDLRARLQSDSSRVHSEEDLLTRLGNAVAEMHQADIADYILRNDDFEACLNELEELVVTLERGDVPSQIRFSNPILLNSCMKATL